MFFFWALSPLGPSIYKKTKRGMDESSLAHLRKKYRQGNCTPEELAQLESWYLSLNADAEPLDPARLTKATDRVGLRLSSITKDTPRTGGRLLKWLPYAAAIVTCLSVATWFLADKVTTVGKPETVSVVDVVPGGNKATLTLADGRAITLDESRKGIVVGKGISYTDGSELVVNADRDNQTATQQQMLSTPKGGMYQITLSDGTNVWLNAASTLTYPDHFASGERVVELKGEAYFDVASADAPFRVISRGQTVEVLGTQFNVRAYLDDERSETTLVEGAVRLVNSISNDTQQLKPGQQGAIKKGRTEIKQVKVDAYVAWKDGTFYFKNTSPEEAFSQISRWYDVEIEYDGTVPTTAFYGVIGRDKNLASVLAILKESGLRFELKKGAGKNVLVVKNET